MSIALLTRSSLTHRMVYHSLANPTQKAAFFCRVFSGFSAQSAPSQSEKFSPLPTLQARVVKIEEEVTQIEKELLNQKMKKWVGSAAFIACLSVAPPVALAAFFSTDSGSQLGAYSIFCAYTGLTGLAAYVGSSGWATASGLQYKQEALKEELFSTRMTIVTRQVVGESNESESATTGQL